MRISKKIIFDDRRLDKLLESKSLTTIANAIKYDRSHISKLRSKKYNCGYDLYVKLCEYFGIQPTDLISELQNSARHTIKKLQDEVKWLQEQCSQCGRCSAYIPADEEFCEDCADEGFYNLKD